MMLMLQTAAERLEEARSGLDLTLAERSIGLLGIATMLGLAVLLSYDRRKINWRLVATGLALQAGFGLIVLKTSAGRAVFASIGDGITGLLRFQEQGARFVFGNLVQSTVPVGTPGVGGAVDTSAGLIAQTGAFFAFNVLPTIIFFSALMSVLYYLGVMQLIVKALAWVMQRTLGTSGAETLSASGNIFLGQTEAPLLIKPFVATMTRSELLTVMVGGFATVAGGVLAALLGAVGTARGLPAAHVWTKVYPGPSTPVWMWVRGPGTSMRVEGEWGVVSFETTATLEPNGLFVTVGGSVAESPVVVELSTPGWADFGRGTLPEGLPDAQVIAAVDHVRPSSARSPFMELFAGDLQDRLQHYIPVADAAERAPAGDPLASFADRYTRASPHRPGGPWPPVSCQTSSTRRRSAASCTRPAFPIPISSSERAARCA